MRRPSFLTLALSIVSEASRSAVPVAGVTMPATARPCRFSIVAWPAGPSDSSSSLWSGLAAPRSLAHVGQLGFFFLLETGLLLTKVGFVREMFVLDVF